MISITDYCLARIGSPFVWGETDCACFARGWAVEGLGAADIPSPRLGSAREWAEYCRQRPMLDRARDWAAEAGLVEASDAPREGDIGIVMPDGRQCFALRCGGQWVARSEQGIAMLDTPHLALFRAA